MKLSIGMKEITCKNCQNLYTGSYCNNCGQNANIQRFSVPYFLRETFFSSLDIEKGFFHTIKILLIKPGSAIREYIEGKRVSLYMPGKFLIIFGAVATFIVMRYNTISTTTETDLSFLTQWFNLDTKGFFSYAEDYTTVVNIFAIPVFALFTWSFFGKRYNYAENLILNTYITAMQLVLLVIITPAIALFSGYQGLIIAIYSIIILLYNVWAVLTFFNEYKITSFFRIGGALACSIVGQFILNYFIYLVVVKYILNISF